MKGTRAKLVTGTKAKGAMVRRTELVVEAYQQEGGGTEVREERQGSIKMKTLGREAGEAEWQQERKGHCNYYEEDYHC